MMLDQDGVDRLIGKIEASGEHKVLRRISVPDGTTAVEYDGGATAIAAVVDVETTGIDTANDVIIELAIRRFRYDCAGQILKVDRPRSWREDPGRSIDEDITKLTGLTDADLVGQQIDEDAAVRLLCSADLIIAHNAAFDRKFVERRLPAAAGLCWCCSCVEINWRSIGFDGRALGWLAMQAGWFYDAHQAINDVDAVIVLLCHRMPDGRTVMADLIDSANCPSVRIEAIGASFGVKDALRLRGYRWNPVDRVWWREVQAKDLIAEESWLGRTVYAPGLGCSLEPRLTGLTARERYA